MLHFTEEEPDRIMKQGEWYTKLIDTTKSGLQIFSLAGEHRRSRSRACGELYFVKDRLYLVKDQAYEREG